MHGGRQTPPLPPTHTSPPPPPVVWLDGGLRCDASIVKTKEKIATDVLQAPSLESDLNFVLFAFHILSNHPYS